MADIAKAYVQIIPSADGIKGKLENALGGGIDSAGQTMGKSLSGSLSKAFIAAGAGAAVASGIAKVVKGSLDEGSALQQSIGGIETLFGNQGMEIEEYAKRAGKSVSEVTAEFERNQKAEAMMMEAAANAYNTAGMSRNEYMQSATSFAATLLQGLEGDTVAAAKYADMAMQDMSDNANKFGTDISSVQNAYQGFAKDNYTMLDNLKLGYGGTQAEMARLLNDAGLLEDGMVATASNVKDIPFDTIIQSINVIQTRLGVTGTTAEEASKTFEGSMKAMQAAGKNVLAGLALGEDVTAPLSSLAQTFMTFVTNNLLPMVGNALSALPTALTTMLQTLAADSGTFVTTALNIITSFSEALMQNLPFMLTAVMEILLNVVEALMSYDWIGTATNLINTFMQSFIENLPRIMELAGQIVLALVNGIINNIPQLITGAVQLITGLQSYIIQNLPTIVAAGIELVASLVAGLIQAIPQTITAVFQMTGEMQSAFKGVDWLSIGVNIIVGIIQGIKNSAGKLAEAAKSAAKAAFEGAKNFLGIHSPSALFRDDVGKMIDLGMAEGIERYTNPVKSAVANLSDMSVGKFNAANQLKAGFGSPQLAMAGGDITIPVYIGSTKMGQAVAKANQSNTYRSGGR